MKNMEVCFYVRLVFLVKGFYGKSLCILRVCVCVCVCVCVKITRRECMPEGIHGREGWILVLCGIVV